MIDIKEIYDKQQGNKLSYKALSEQKIIGSTKLKSKDIISVFKRDIRNIIIYFIVLIPAVTVILLSKSVNPQSVAIGLIIVLASIYIALQELLFIRKIQIAEKTVSLIDNIKSTTNSIKKWSHNGRYHILLPAVIILNALLMLANGLSESELPINSFNIWYSIVFSTIFIFALNYWIKHKELQYTTQLNLLDDDSYDSDELLNKQKKGSRFTFVIISLIGLVLLLIIFYIMIQ